MFEAIKLPLFLFLSDYQIQFSQLLQFLNNHGKSGLLNIFDNRQISQEFSEFNDYYRDFKRMGSVRNVSERRHAYMESKHWEILLRNFTRDELRELAGNDQVIPSHLWNQQQIRPAATHDEQINSCFGIFLTWIFFVLGICLNFVLFIEGKKKRGV